ncbi:MAG: molybdate ABC transporter substrate-binding protein [Deltaproteobacteria bacterium]|nr:molybdate ABC transporter substrate-binding protein [Deltaproteobacteria bacterium]
MGILPGARAWGEDLIVSAGAGMAKAMTAVGQAYEKNHPGVKVIFNFAASGTLLQQMVQGAPVDVFASADQITMDKAAGQGLILKGSRTDFARNALVLAVPAGSPLGLRGVRDLTRKEVKTIAIGNPEVVPAGRYARQSFVAEGLWDKLLDKFVYANTVSQVLDYLKRGEVDAGLIYGTDALQGDGKIRVVAEVKGHEPIVFPIAVISSSRRQQAGDFIRFVCSSEMRAVFGSYGFLPVKGNDK